MGKLSPTTLLVMAAGESERRGEQLPDMKQSSGQELHLL